MGDLNERERLVVTKEDILDLACLVMREDFFQDSMKIITKWLEERGIEVEEQCK